MSPYKILLFSASSANHWSTEVRPSPLLLFSFSVSFSSHSRSPSPSPSHPFSFAFSPSPPSPSLLLISSLPYCVFPHPLLTPRVLPLYTHLPLSSHLFIPLSFCTNSPSSPPPSSLLPSGSQSSSHVFLTWNASSGFDGSIQFSETPVPSPPLPLPSPSPLEEASSPDSGLHSPSSGESSGVSNTPPSSEGLSPPPTPPPRSPSPSPDDSNSHFLISLFGFLLLLLHLMFLLLVIVLVLPPFSLPFSFSFSSFFFFSLPSPSPCLEASDL